MTLAAAYNSDFGRVVVTADGLPYFTIHPKGFARLQRSRDGVYWKDVRGGREIAPIPTDESLADGEISLNDYEFWENEENTYRLLMPVFLDDFDRGSSSGWGSAASGQAYSVSGTATNYFISNRRGVMRWVTTSTGARSATIGSAVTSADMLLAANMEFSVSTPSGASLTADFLARFDSGTDNYILAGITFDTNGDVFIGINNYESDVVTHSVSRDISDLMIRNTDGEFRMELWLEGAVARLRVYPAGSDPGDWLLATDELTVTGAGVSGIDVVRNTGNTNNGLEFYVSEFLEELAYAVDETSAPVTPTVSRCWLKSIDRPFLNREFDIADVSDVRFSSRGRIDYVHGRSSGIYQREVSSGEQFVLSVYSHSRGERQWLNHIVRSGDIIFVQPHNPDGTAAVPEHDIPRGFYAITAATESRTARRTSRRIHALTLTCVAEPSADVYGQMSSWQTVIDTWESWQELIEQSGETWFDLLDLVGNPSEVVVP